MPRVVCQVRSRPDRVTFVWSAGKASFEPYHLDSPEALEGLRQQKHAAEQVLASALAGLAADAPPEDVARAGRALAEIGHRLFRHVLPADNAVAREVHDWLTGLETESAVEGLEFLGDYDLLPWDVLYDRPPGEGDDVWPHFWGVRHSLSGGRRCGPLRPVKVLEQPAVLLAIDPGSRDSLGEQQRERLSQFVADNNLHVVESVADLARAVRAQTPDVLYLFGRAEPDGLTLGDAPLTAADLEDLLRGENSGDLPWNSRVVFVNACRSDPAEPWLAGQRWHALGLGGLVLAEGPPAADRASAFGLDLLAGFLYQGEPIGPLAQKLRRRAAPLGLLYRVCCPPWLRVTWQEDEAAAAAPPNAEAELPPLPEGPYRPLIPYDREDRALFVGRENDTALVADLLDAPRARLVLVHGRAGVGKSSLLRAGVLPYLEEEGVGYRALRYRGEEQGAAAEGELPVIAVRATSDLPGQLALALSAACGGVTTYTTPTGRDGTVDLPGILRRAVGAVSEDVGPDALRAALLADPTLFGRLLTTLADSLPDEPILLIEQGEEVFTLARQRADAEDRQAALDMLRRAAAGSGAGKVAVLLRTEYYGRLVSPLRRDLLQAGGIRDYFLTELDEGRMVAAVLQPTLAEPIPYTAEVPLEKYGFRYEEGLPESIVRQVRETAQERQESPLPLLQTVCARLAQVGADRPDRTIREADVRAVGIGQGLGGYVETLIGTVTPLGREKRRLWELLGRLGRVQPDGTITRDLVPADQLAEKWRGPTPLDTIIERGAAEDVRLFDVEWLGAGDREKRYVGLTHDAVAVVAAHRESEETIRRQHGRKVMIDWLWVVIPLCLLLAVVAWFWNSYRVGYAEVLAAARKAQQGAQQQLSTYEQGIEQARWLIYLADLNKAEDAWRRGEAMRLRQALLNHRKNPRPADDVRGFEWYHFWQLTDRSRATLVGHEGPVPAIALAPDGKMLASASADGTVRLWGLGPPGQRGILKLDAGAVNAVAFAKDRRLAIGGDDGTIRIVDLNRAQKGPATKAFVLKGHTGPVLNVTFSPDGKTVAAAGADGTVRLWDAGDGNAGPVLKEHKGPVAALAFSPDGKRLASGGEDGKVVLWAPATGAKQRALTDKAGAVAALAFSPDGKVLAAAGSRKEDGVERGEVHLWDPESGKETRPPLVGPAPVASLAFAGDGKSLFTGGKDFAIRLWNVAAGKEQDVFRGHLGWVDALAVTKDGKTVLSGSHDGTIKLWAPDLPGARQVLTGHKGPALALALSADNKLLASGGQDGTIRLWDSATGKQVRVLQGDPGPVVSVALARGPKGKLLVASAHAPEGKGDGVVLVWDGDKGEKLHTLKGHQGAATGVALAPDGSLLATGGADKTVLLWDVASGAIKRKLTGLHAEVRSLTFSAPGRLLAGGDAGGAVRLWDVQTGGGEGQAGRALAGRHAGPVTALAFTADEHTLVSGSADQAIKFWAVDDGRLFDTLKTHAGPILALALSPQAQAMTAGDLVLPIPATVAAGGTDPAVRLWDGGRDELRFAFTGLTGPIRGVVFSSDRRLLAAATGDGTIRIWRSAPEEPPAPREKGEPQP